MERVRLSDFSCLCAFLAFLCFHQFSVAQTKAKVLKTKGNKAIIRIDSGERLERGDRLDIHLPGLSSFKSVEATGWNSRKNFIGGAFSYTQSRQTTSRENIPDDDEDTTAVALEALYGWNSKKYEFGAELSYQSVSSDGDTSSSLALGGFFEYNFQKLNAGGERLVPSVGASLALRSETIDSSSGDGFLMSVFVGGKYFILTPTLAVTGFLEVERDSVSYSSGTEIEGLNTRLVVGLRQYL